MHISLLISVASVVFGMYLSARATFLQDRKPTAIRPSRQLPILCTILLKYIYDTAILHISKYLS